MRRFAANFAIIAIVLLSVRFASAGAVVPKDIGANAKWFAHVNFEAIRSMKLVQDFKERCPMYEHCHAKAEELGKKLGMNPMKDVLGLTLYCDTYGQHVGVGLVAVKKLNRERLVNFLREKHPDYKTSEYGSRLLYSWCCHEHCGHHKHCGHHGHCAHHELCAHHEDCGQHKDCAHHKLCAHHEHCGHHEHCAQHEHHGHKMHVTAAFASDTLIVVGTDKAHVEAALDVLDGKKPALAKDAPLLKGIPNTALVAARAMDIPENNPETAHCPLLSNCKTASAVWTETKGQIMGRYELTALSDKTAGEFKAVADGLVAFGRLRFSGLPVVAKLLDGVKCGAKGAMFTATVALSTTDVEAAAKSLMEQKKASHECHMGHGPHGKCEAGKKCEVGKEKVEVGKKKVEASKK